MAFTYCVKPALRFTVILVLLVLCYEDKWITEGNDNLKVDIIARILGSKRRGGQVSSLCLPFGHCTIKPNYYFNGL